MTDNRMSRDEFQMAEGLLRKLTKAEESAATLNLYLTCNDRNEEHQRRFRMIKHKISEAVRELEDLINEATLREVPVNEGDVYGIDCRSGSCEF